VSVPIAPTFSAASSDPAAIDIMNAAYAKACRLLHDRGQPTVVQEIIAARIARIAKSGERDPNRICERVLMDLGLQADS
jgi:hypothetical protein